MTLSLLKSRWMTPAWWAASSPAAICCTSGSAAAGSIRPCAPSRRRSVWPASNSMVRNACAVGAGGLPEVEDAADVGVGDPPGQQHLALQAPDGLGVAGQIGGQRLQRHLLVQQLVLGLVDLAHAAAPDEAVDPVAVGDDAAGGQGRGPAGGRGLGRGSRAHVDQRRHQVAAGGADVQVLIQRRQRRPAERAVQERQQRLLVGAVAGGRRHGDILCRRAGCAMMRG